MSLGKIWERYFVYEVLKSWCFVLFIFYGLYILIDYASHAASFHRHASITWTKILTYYFHEFFKRLDIILPFALLIATIRTLCSFNVHNELIALVASGTSFKRLLGPFILLGLVGTSILYLNTQYLQPESLHALRRIETQRSLLKQKAKAKGSMHALSIELKDHSKLIYQAFDEENARFFDVFWIRNIGDIYRIKYLYPNENTGIPVGEYIDHLVRDKDGTLIVQETVMKSAFPQMAFSKEALLNTKVPPEEQSLTSLWQNRQETGAVKAGKIDDDQEVQERATFYHKLFMPWLCLLVVMGAAPFCLRVTRNLPVFFIYSISIFGFVAFNLIISTSFFLAKRFFVMPGLGLSLPFLTAFSFFGWRFFRLK